MKPSCVSFTPVTYSNTIFKSNRRVFSRQMDIEKFSKRTISISQKSQEEKEKDGLQLPDNMLGLNRGGKETSIVARGNLDPSAQRQFRISNSGKSRCQNINRKAQSPCLDKESVKIPQFKISSNLTPHRNTGSFDLFSKTQSFGSLKNNFVKKPKIFQKNSPIKTVNIKPSKFMTLSSFCEKRDAFINLEKEEESLVDRILRKREQIARGPSRLSVPARRNRRLKGFIPSPRNINLFYKKIAKKGSYVVS